jgi:tyrosine-protein phosphatase YwqE
MLKIFSKSSPKNEMDYSFIRTDIHSHLIPGIDDGPQDMETSLALIKGMAEIGFQKMITTPHIMWDMYKNNKKDLLERLELVKEEVKKQNWTVGIETAAEYFLDDHVSDLLKGKERLLTIDDSKVLVEFSMASPALSLKDILFEMQMQGYQPVIAHPERYIYLEHGKQFYDELKDLGCLFQLNILSLGTYYGKSVHELALYLAKKGYYNLVGTDLHHIRHLEALRNPSLITALKKIFDSGKILNPSL